MTDDRWRLVEEIFGEAIERAPEERAAFVASRCGSDAELRREVESLLAEHRDDTFLQQLAVPTDVAGALAHATGGRTGGRTAHDTTMPTNYPVDAVDTPSRERLGPYEILGTLGRGGMGVVYRARHVETGRLAAVKTVAVPKQSLLASFRREIHALARLRHPGIVSIFDEGVHEGLPWYAMEELEGVSLRTYARGAAAGDLAAMLTVVRRLCAPLAFLHGEGIVHRDLKPDNVLVLTSAIPVLVDFGIASFFAGSAGREALEVTHGGGTPAYMAPEQLRNGPVDARADLYALGCVLYELLTGRPPFRGPTDEDVVRAHLEATPVPPSELVPALPPALDALALRLLAKEPADRLGHADAVSVALAKLGAEGPPGDWPRPRAYLYRARFAGREDAMAEARRRLTALAAGTGVLLLVEGESGVGKTRLALQIANAATTWGARVLVGESPPREAGAGGAPLEALRKPLQAIADRCRERGPRETDRILGARAKVLAAYEPALAELPTGETYPEPQELTAGAARRRVFSYLAEAFAALAEARPVLMILDDLQWADDLTIAWLAYLLRGGHFERRPIFVIGAYRSEEVGADLRDLAASPRASRLRLGRLEEADVASIVADMLALSPPPPPLSRFLSKQSEGNPFFVAEYLRAAVEERLLWRDEEGAWQVAEPGAATAGEEEYRRLGLPGSLRALVRVRFEGLPESAAAIASAAATAGREADSAVLARITGLGDVDFLEAIDELLRRRVVEEVEPGRLRFAHDKLREVAYDAIEPGRRARLHRAAAETIEAVGTERDRQPASLGHHWEQAGEPERAAAYYLAGAKSMKGRYANAESIRLYRAYLGLVERPTRERVAARNELGNLLRIDGRATEAVEEHLGAIEEARKIGNRRAEGESAEGAGSAYLTLGQTERAVDCFETALVTSRAEADSRGEAGALAGLATAFATRGDFEQARDFYERALAIQQARGDLRGEGITMRNLGVALASHGHLDEGRTRLERALAIARETGARHSEGLALCGLADIRYEQGSLEEARSLFEQALRVIREVGDRQFEGIPLVNLATIRAEEGCVEEASALYEEALTVSRNAGDRRGEGFVLVDMATLERRVGDPERAERLFREAETVFQDIGDRLYVGLCVCGLGQVALARNLPPAPLLERARALAAEVSAGPESRLGRAVSQLESAAMEAGRLLHRGERVTDVPEGLRRWLVATGRLAADALE